MTLAVILTTGAHLTFDADTVDTVERLGWVAIKKADDVVARFRQEYVVGWHFNKDVT